MLTIAVLGPFEVSSDGSPVAVSAGRQRALLARLAMAAGEVVSVERLTEAAWDAELPEDTRRTVQINITRLRAVLGRNLIRTRPTGYALELDADQVDALRFLRLVDAADRVSGPHEHTLLREATALWRGQPFEGVRSAWLEESTAPWLAERYLSAVERRLDLDIAGGRTEKAIAELADLTARHPLRETLWLRLLVALAGGRRYAEALEQYAALRSRLADELGVDPCPELRAAHADLLAGRVPQGAAPVPRDGVALVPRAPRQLPAAAAVFTGRSAELEELVSRAEGTGSPAVVISAIDGMAGAGKTALAVQAAHRLAARYPDGQIFLDLHGFTQGMTPIDPPYALARVLYALGVPAKQIPADLEDRSALMRTLLAGRRVLLVLDNAADEDQVRPLLPGTRSCRVLITSRRRLAGLDEASLMSLSALPPAQAAELFVRAAAQHGRTAPPAPAVAELVALCGRLPLAIRIAAARLGAHPSWNAGDFLARLRDHEQRLAELTVGQRGIIAALDLSGRHLTVGQLRLYRLLGLHPGPEIDAYAAAALAGITPEKARTILDDLCQVHLLVESRPGRYRFHDLIRVHASQACAEHEPDTARHAARTRLFDHYAQMVSACTEVLYPGEGPHASYITAVGPPLLVPASKAEAVAWIDSELGNLLAVAGHAARHGWPRHAIHLSVTLFHHLAGVRGYLRSAEILHQHALSAARATGDRIGLLRVLVCLGDVHRLAGRWQSAIANLEQAAALAREVGDQAAEQFALLGLGYACFFQGQPGRAARYHKQAMNVARAIGNRAGEIEPLLGLGLVRTQLGECDQASRSLTRALVVAIQTGNRIGQLRSLCGLGILHTIEGRYDDALGRYGQALILARETGDRMAEIYARYGHGHVNRLLGRPGPAAEELERTLAIARETGDPMGQAMALCALGHLHRAAGRLDMALSVHQRAVGLAHGTFVQVRAHYGLGHAYHARGQRDDARRQWQQALKLLTSLGIANDTEVSADDIRAALGTGQRAR